MIVRSKAPLRLGLAGGGTDVSPYSDTYGGYVLNATINQYAYCHLEEIEGNMIYFSATDINQHASCEAAANIDIAINPKLALHIGVYNHLHQLYELPIRGIKMTTYSDAPPGSGLGSSSTMVVGILKAFVEYYSLPLGEYDIAQLAYTIERVDLNLSGGKQDQYAATFGGFNFMEFLPDAHVIINPLRIKRWVIDELESSMLLYYTGASRSSAAIIDEQKNNAKKGDTTSVEAMHKIKESALRMKEAILRGDIPSLGKILGEAWIEKKKMASAISNASIEKIFDVAVKNGACCGKVSGAGGGGFIMFFIKPENRIQLVTALNQLSGDGYVVPFSFSDGGCHGWKVY